MWTGADCCVSGKCCWMTDRVGKQGLKLRRAAGSGRRAVGTHPPGRACWAGGMVTGGTCWAQRWGRAHRALAGREWMGGSMCCMLGHGLCNRGGVVSPGWHLVTVTATSSWRLQAPAPNAHAACSCWHRPHQQQREPVATWGWSGSRTRLFGTMVSPCGAKTALAGDRGGNSIVNCCE